MSSRGEDKLIRDARLQGHYEVLSRIGAGGFGTVFQARQVATGQMVAVKVLKPGAREGATSKRAARFQREMRLCARLHHTNIVRLIDSGRTDDGQIYLVFEFVPGKNLKEVLREEGALDPQEARHLMLQVLDALAAAHAQGITHRDLKPSNIMIMPTGARRNALVLDFGIGAIAEDGEAAGELTLTGDDELLGTPAYAAPEQLQGRVATPRADLFAWGLVFLECMTGQPLFSGRRVAEVVSMQLDPEPIPVPAALLRHPVGRLLSRALAKEVEARQVTAEGLLRELEACDLSDLPRGLRAGPEPGPGAAARPAASTAQGAGRAPASPSRLPGEGSGQRRLLTAVCCSLQVSAPERDCCDVEERDELLRAQQEICFEVARRFQGTVAGALGERVLLCFGHPVAGEDDAERAARAALEIAARIGELGHLLEAGRRLGPQVRIGAHTGLVIVAEGGEASAGGSGACVGTTATVAAHLSGLAPPGAVLLSGDTRRLLRDRFVTEPLGPCQLGGGAGQVEVHRVAAERPSIEPRVAALPMIGRTHELALLSQRWRRAREGFGQSVFITGQPGIGKSRLAAELYREIRGEPHFWIECRCAPENRSSALRPVIEALEQLADIDERQTPEEKAGKLRALLTAYGFRLGDTMPLLASLLSIPAGDDPAPVDVAPQRRKKLTLRALVSLLTEMAERRPVLFLLEDLQWADPTTLELLTRLLPEVAAARVCVLLTARPEFSPPWPLAGTLQIQLCALESGQVAALIASIAAGKELPPRVVERVIEQAEGVPLFVEELARAAIESGASVDERAAREPLLTERPSCELAIPTPLRASLTARLDRLGRARETAQLASALGREFSAKVLAEISALDEAAVQEDLDRLVAADILFLRRRARQSTYVFRHVLLRDAAYESLPRRARQRAHARIARALEARFPEIAAERPGLLAMHHAKAEQKREAIAYGRAAARRALHRSMNAEAIAAAFQAISWLDALEEPRERAEAELDLNQITIAAVASIRSFAAEEVDSAVRRSQQLIERVGDGSHALAMLWARFNHRWRRGDAEQAHALAQQYVALSERAGDAQHATAAHLALGRSLLIAARLDEAQAALERAVALYDPEQHRGSALVFGVDLAVGAQVALGAVLWSKGYLERSAAWLRSADEAAGALQDAGTTCHQLVHAAMVHHCRRDRGAIASAAQRLLGLAEPLGLTQWLTFGGLLRAWLERDVEGADRLLADMSAAGMGQPYPRWSSLVAESEMDLGRFDAALARLDRCLLEAGVVQERRCVAELHRLKGDCLRCLGDGRAAERSYREAVELARGQGARSLELRASLHLARLLEGEGRYGEVHDALARALRGFPEGRGWSELAAAEAMMCEAAIKLAAA